MSASGASLSKSLIAQPGDELYKAMRSRTVLEPLRPRHQQQAVDDAYLISEHTLHSASLTVSSLSVDKMGLTSSAVKEQLGVNQPKVLDVGYIYRRASFRICGSMQCYSY